MWMCSAGVRIRAEGVEWVWRKRIGLIFLKGKVGGREGRKGKEGKEKAREKESVENEWNGVLKEDTEKMRAKC
jgi:hypothetical protein